MLLALGIAGLFASSIYAQNPLSTELKQGYAMEKGFIVKSVAKMAEADYSFKPTPQVRSFGELANHVLDVQGALCATVKGDGKKFMNASTDKASVTAYAKQVFDYCDAVYDGMTDAAGLQMTKMFGMDKTKYGVLDFAIQHDNEGYGTMVVYMRLKGIVPPSSEGRGMEGGKK